MNKTLPFFNLNMVLLLLSLILIEYLAYNNDLFLKIVIN
jgi:hypothetical protein